jgi:serine protease Do
LTSALLLGGATATLALQPEANAQTAQNEPGAIAAMAPKPGAPMSFADMVARLQPAVVNISTSQTVRVAQPDNGMADLMGRMFGLPVQPQGPATRQAQSLGSGFIISADGYIVTNNHVVSAGTTTATVDSITVTLPDRKEYKAKLVGRDVASDLAVLKIEGNNLPFVKFGDSARARVGDWVVAIGNPFGLGSTVTAGIVSALHRVTGQGGAYDRFIQTDASINQGNSGGPMFNLNGDVIGINSQIFSPTGGNVGIGFAIPAEEAKPIIETLMKGGTIARGYIGVSIAGGVNDDAAAALGIPKNQGDIITRVEADGPAARAGIRVGDVVTRINGQPVTPDDTLTRLVAAVRPGATARFDILRDNRPLSVNVTVAKRPSEEQLAQQLNGGEDGDFGRDNNDRPQGAQPSAFGPLGIDGRTVTPGIAQATGVPPGTRGVAVLTVDPNSDAAQKLRYRDVITQVNFTQIGTVEDLNRVVGAAKTAGRTTVVVYGFRQRNPIAVTVKIR